MAHFFSSLLLFWLKSMGLTAFVVIGLVILIALSARLKMKTQKGVLTIENLSVDLKEQQKALEAEILDKKAFKALEKQRKKEEKAKKGQCNKRLFVLEFKGDMQAHDAEGLADTVTALLQIASEEDQVLVKVDSPGGVVHRYGFAASQLARIRDRGVTLTISVDQVAASGGYLMAVVGHEIIASPFAIIGSIGVLAQIPNFHRFLKEKGIDFEQVTAGEYKRTVTMFGENTKKDREKLKEQLELIHAQFKGFIEEYRPQVDVAKIATGEYWLAKNALSLGLIDKLQTSEDFIMSVYQQDYDIYRLKLMRKKPLGSRLGEFFSAAIPKSWMMH